MLLDLRRMAAYAHAEDRARPLGRRQQPAQRLDDRRLPRSVGPKEAEQLSLAHREAHILHSGEVPEADGQPVRGDDRRHRSRTVADMPDFSTPSGLSTLTLTPNTWCLRSSRVCTLRGKNSACDERSSMCAENCRFEDQSTSTSAC